MSAITKETVQRLMREGKATFVPMQPNEMVGMGRDLVEIGVGNFDGNAAVYVTEMHGEQHLLVMHLATTDPEELKANTNEGNLSQMA